MAFSTTQQKMYRTLVEAAWRTHAAANGLALKDKATRNEWYRAILWHEFRKWSTTELSTSREFAPAMAAFEAIVGASIYWQMRCHKEGARSIVYTIRKLCQDHDLAEDYAERIAANATGQEHRPQLDEMSAPKLLVVLRALKIHIRRHMVADPMPPADAPEGDDPF